ncbi:MAG: GyrI-like domain-containing protein [Bacteroidota bacterium]
MFLRTQTLPEKYFIGKRLNMSFAQNKTFELWRSFMPRHGEIQNTIGTEFYSIEIYPVGFYNDFNPNQEFEKWAAVEVSDAEIVPPEMETLISPEGLYAVFLHKGPAIDGPATYQYIFQQWLPASAFQLDKRPHFAIMGKKYKPDDPASEEEIWIPVTVK